MSVVIEMPLADLKRLRSNDYPDSLVGELSRVHYPNRSFIFDDLEASIFSEGITKPVRVVNDRLVDGHHRAIIAIEMDLETILVEYSGYDYYLDPNHRYTR